MPTARAKRATRKGWATLRCTHRPARTWVAPAALHLLSTGGGYSSSSCLGNLATFTKWIECMTDYVK